MKQSELVASYTACAVMQQALIRPVLRCGSSIPSSPRSCPLGISVVAVAVAVVFLEDLTSQPLFSSWPHVPQIFVFKMQGP